MMRPNPAAMRVTLVGHPFAPIGMGELLRSAYRSLNAAGVEAEVVDLYGWPDADPALLQEFASAIVDRIASDLIIFCINADEVAQAEETLAARRIDTGGGRRIIYPTWELAVYPRAWAEILNRFDEIWAPSGFIRDALACLVDRPLYHLPLGCEVPPPKLCTRRDFGLPEHPFAFLFSFDYLSFVDRKNPAAALRAFREMRKLIPERACVLVLKTQHGDRRPDMHRRLLEEVARAGDDVFIVDQTLPIERMRALVGLCDCYLSLHRSEGFGLGIAEAMYLGKPVLATGYGGNLDFCDQASAGLVGYDLVPVPRGAYTHHEGQVWAEPDVDDAARRMAELVANPAEARRRGKAGQVRLLRDFSYRAAGLRYRDRLTEIVSHRGPAA